MAGRRESKKAATRSALARAAAEIVLFDGADGLTVPAITAKAGVSVRTFHNYFSSREQSLQEFITERVTALIHDLEEIPEEFDLLSAVEQLVVTHLRTSDDELESFPTLIQLSEVVESLSPHSSEQAVESAIEPIIPVARARVPELSEFQRCCCKVGAVERPA
ncbi:TetR/AcrR family transcriptional regulator [Corynebacterium sanguinis]|uniref:TetR/AcrR family transcriptional regulator n=1 Tax=Corynebacterium sanguinis TaxID=2594913 RepID=UPI00119DAC83|nr:TetR/AcrR family transcriptional regulator [Corynebacterium sanguinis]MCT2253077.1 TetR/AcrR family transcriptional regulator [Corynebacterium sanguinis]TVS22907.1 TetR/AcrR family transcriptional regulator [Corynebacterium sanguinis]